MRKTINKHGKFYGTKLQGTNGNTLKKVGGSKKEKGLLQIEFIKIWHVCLKIYEIIPNPENKLYITTTSADRYWSKETHPNYSGVQVSNQPTTK